MSRLNIPGYPVTPCLVFRALCSLNMIIVNERRLLAEVHRNESDESALRSHELVTRAGTAPDHRATIGPSVLRPVGPERSAPGRDRRASNRE